MQVIGLGCAHGDDLSLSEGVALLCQVGLVYLASLALI